MSLCRVCADALGKFVLPDRYPHDEEQPLHPSVLEYLEGVDQKCYICWRTWLDLGNHDRRQIRRLGLFWKNHGKTVLAGDIASTRPKPFSVFCIRVFETPGGRDIKIRQKCEAEEYIEFLAAISSQENSPDDTLQEDELDDLFYTLSRLGYQFIFLCSANRVTNQPRIAQTVPTAPGTDSPETFRLIESWIHECASEHTPCISRQADKSWRPTRLLDVGDPLIDGLQVPEYCCVVDGTTATSSCGYITLSHRWGTGHIIKLTAENISQFRTGIPVVSLPRTFIDCIFAARRLKIRHIWIDSLCIIQSGDGGADWLREAVTMHLVYTNAYCNISADWGDDSQGLFFERDLRLFDQLTVECKTESNRTTARFFSVEPDIWNKEVTDSPLNNRAWVFQERLLSARNLHFCRREVFWECCQTTHCETLPDANLPSENFSGDATGIQYPGGLKSFDLSPFYKNMLIRAADPAQGDTRLELDPRYPYAVWIHIVLTYTRTKLTFQSDKLIALAGIASHMKARLKDTYIAGLWTRYLPRLLMWRPRWEGSLEDLAHRDAQGTLPKSYRAPSFSWASVDCPIRAEPLYAYLDGFIVDLSIVKFRPPEAAETEAWEDEPVTQDIFGPLSHPVVELKVTGKLFPGRIHRHPGDRIDGVPTYRGELFGYIYPLGHSLRRDTFEDTYMTGFPLRYQRMHGGPSKPEVEFDCPPSELEADDFFQKVYYYAPWRNIRSTTGLQGSSFCGMVLESIDPSMGRFRRVGMFEIHHDYNSRELEEQADLYLNASWEGHEVNSWSYDDSTGLHTLYVV